MLLFQGMCLSLYALCLFALYCCLIIMYRWSLSFLAALHNLKLFVICQFPLFFVENKFFFFPPFPMVYFRFHSPSHVQPSFIHIHFPVPSVIPISFPPAATPVLGAYSLFFVGSMKQITSKLTTNWNLVSKTTENEIKIQMSKLGHFSPISVFLLISGHRSIWAL